MLRGPKLPSSLLSLEKVEGGGGGGGPTERGVGVIRTRAFELWRERKFGTRGTCTGFGEANVCGKAADAIIKQTIFVRFWLVKREGGQGEGEGEGRGREGGRGRVRKGEKERVKDGGSEVVQKYGRGKKSGRYVQKLRDTNVPLPTVQTSPQRFGVQSGQSNTYERDK